MPYTRQPSTLDCCVTLPRVSGVLRRALQLLHEADRPLLRAKATELKQQGGAGWTVGEAVERLCIVFDVLDMVEQPFQKGGSADAQTIGIASKPN